MVVVFRCDASVKIGNGHIMRCLTLADALRESGAECFFISRNHLGNLTNFTMQKGYETYCLSAQDKQLNENQSKLSQYHHWLGTDMKTDANETASVIKEIIKKPVNWIIVDHYSLDKNWEQALQPYCEKIMVIDDIANRIHDCDLLLDQTLAHSINDYKNLTPKNCTHLIGTKYALLRPEFAKMRKPSITRRQNPTLCQLLISLGGVDKDNITMRILEYLQDSSYAESFEITLVMGPNSPWINTVKKWVIENELKTLILSNVDNMAELMVKSDLCIGAAGTSSWERCCLGLPTLLITLEENQVPIANSLHGHQAAIYLANQNNINRQHIFSILSKLDADLSILKKMSNAAFKLVDGNGVNRVLETMQI